MPHRRRFVRGTFARSVLATAVGAIVGSLSLSAVAQGVPPTQPSAPPAGAGEFKWPDFAAMTKDMQASSGLLTVYRYNPNDPTKDSTRMLAAIPRGLLKQDLLLAVSGSRGSSAGWQLDDYLVRFEMLGRQIRLTVPDSRYVQKPGQPVTDAVARTYTSRFLASMPILTMTPAGDPVVDLGAVLMGPGIVGPGMGMGAPRRDLSEITKVKVFPDNALIDVDLAIAGMGGGGQTVGISYAFRRLPALGEYSPRVADERLGYFTTVRQDWSIKHSERETILRYVNRWDIKKKDPSLEMSPPDKPIVFVVEKTVPLQWRRYVKEGIEEWNKAFEKIGIVNAIVVQQQTEDNEFATVDPEDARYNFIRWIVTGRAFAMGPSRADPRTGQILDADIIFDDSFLRHYHESMKTFGPAPAASAFGPELLEFLEKNPAFIPAGQTLEEVQAARRGVKAELLQGMGPAADGAAAGSNRAAQGAGHGAGHDHAECGYAEGLQHQMALMHFAAAAAAPGKKIPEKFIGQMLKEVVAHEVGHTLGLRHNFKASSWLSLEEIKKRRDTSDEPTFASVMDYNPILYFPGDVPEKMRNYISSNIGPYDEWVIEYGYRTPGKDDGGEAKMLSAIAQQNTKKEYAYATDEDTMGLASVDPFSNRYDMGDDPVAWAKVRGELADQLLKDIKKWAVQNDEPNHYLRQAFLTVMSEKTRNMSYVSRVVGGQVHNRNRPGDPNAKPALVLVEPKKQREALQMLGETLFNEGYLAVEAELFNELAPSRWMDWASSPSSRLDFPVHQTFGNMQAYALMNICSPQVLQRVYDAELKSKAEDKFTAAELLTSVRNIVWNNMTISEDATYTDAKPLLGSVRRNLQRQHLQYLLGIVDSEPGALVSPDLQAMVRYSLRDLNGQITKVLEKTKGGEGVANGSRLDFGTRAHLTEAKSQIDRVLEAPYIKLPQPRMIMMGGFFGAEGQKGQGVEDQR